MEEKIEEKIENKVEEKQERKRDKLPLIILILLLLLTVTVGYSVVSTNLTINGNSSFRRSEWNVHMENIKVVTGSNLVVTSPTVTSNGTIISFAVDFNIVNDTFEFTTDVYNEGTIDAKLSSLVKSGLTSEQEEYVEYDITYADGRPINVNDVLNAGEKAKIKVKLKYLKLFPIDEDDFSNSMVTVSVVFKLDYVQK